MEAVTEYAACGVADNASQEFSTAIFHKPLNLVLKYYCTLDLIAIANNTNKEEEKQPLIRSNMRGEHLHLTALVLLCLLLQSALSDDVYDHIWLGEPRPARAASAMGSGDIITVIDYDYAGGDTTQAVSPSRTVGSASSSTVAPLTSVSSSTTVSASSLPSATPTPAPIPNTYDGSGGDTMQVLSPSSTVVSLPSASSPPSASPTLPPTYDGSGDDTMQVLSPSSTVVSLPSASSPPSASPTLPPTYDGSGGDTMQVLSPSSTVVSLPSVLSPPSASPTLPPTYDNSGDDTMQVLSPSSTVVPLPSTSSSTVVALPSTSSSTVLLLPSTTPTPTPMLPDAPSCTLPKDVVSPSTVAGTEEELRQKALCHAACVADQVARLQTSERRVLAGYPVWNVVPDSFLIPGSGSNRDCQQYNYRVILECERGCLTRYSGTPSDRCGGTCRSNCRTECHTYNDPFCGSTGRCQCSPRYELPCGLNCVPVPCNTGCNKHDNLINEVYPPSANPDAPPLLYQSGLFPTQYCVNVTPPSGTDMRTVSALLFRVEDIDVTPRNYSYFWIRELKINLESFANRVVNVSFAVATPRGLSEYSPATTIRVPRGNGTQFPEQLSGFNFSTVPDERRGFFQHYTVNLVWERPDNYELITDYTITLSPYVNNPVCGTTAEFTAGPNVTSFTLQATEPNSPPISICSYSITVEVNPRRDGDRQATHIISIPRYPTPNSTHIHTTCPRVFNRVQGNYIYTFTWRVDFSEAFLSAVNNSRVDLFEIDPQGKRQNLLQDSLIANIARNDNYTYEYIGQVFPLTEPNNRYQLRVKLAYNRQLRQPPQISANCTMVQTPVPPPDNITDLRVTEQRVTVTGGQTVVVTVNFTWTEPEVPYGRLGNYEVWLGSRALQPREEPPQRQSIQASARNSLQSATFTADESTFTVYLQMRARTELGGVFNNWTKVEIPISTIPPDVMTGIRVSNISHVITSGATGPMVTIKARMMWTPPSVLLGNVTGYHLWVGERPLKLNENPSGYKAFEEGMVSTVIDENFELQNNSLDVFVQMRAISEFDLEGNWSDAIQIRRIRLLPSPGNITAVISENIRVVSLENGLSRVFGEVELKWEAPDSPTGLEDVVTTYQSWVGREALDQFETPPSPPHTFEVGGVTGNADFAVDIETANIDNITIVVQMRSTSAANSSRSRRQVDINYDNGPWSDPMILPVLVPPQSFLPAILGTSLSVGTVILLILLVLLVLLCVVCIKSWLFKRKLEKEPQNLVMLGKDPRKPSFIPLAKIEGMEPLLDDWEVPASEVIVEDKLGEGAFGEVFKGIIKGPLRNPKISAVLKHTIGIPVAIKLLKPTASGKEKADFLSEIDMMKKIAEGFNPHIVNMVGCVTLQEPLCLITEFVPFGDLLSFLRSNRKKTNRMKRRERLMQAQVQEQAQLEQVILEQAQLEQAQLEQAQVEQAQVEQTQMEQTQVKQQGPDQEEAAAPYLEARDEYSRLLPPEAQLQSVEVEVAPRSELTQDEPTPAPYLEPKNEYSHLDPKQAAQEEEEEDLYPDLGDLESNDLIQFAYQIASGMEYLASLNIVHRDLACRNILLGEDKKLKITDFGMSREVEEVYVKKTKGRLPLKWMAIESIISREFTASSDVWAYGVVLWEIGTLGGFPYPTIPNQDLLMMLKQGYRLEKPDNCGPEVYEIMLECWNEDPQDRPTFSQLRTKFGTLILAGKDDLYIDLQVDEMKPYYLVKEEEENKEGSSSSSSSSEGSIASIEQIKEKTSEKETLKPKPSNPYVESPSQMTQPSSSTAANPRRPPELTEEPIEEERDVGEPTEPELEESPYADQLPSRPIPRPGNQVTVPMVVEQPAQTAVNGVPVSMFRPEKITSPECDQHSNPYTDEPSTKCNGQTAAQ